MSEISLFRVSLRKGINLINVSAGKSTNFTLAMLALRVAVEMGLPIEQLLGVTFIQSGDGGVKRTQLQ